jgi:hypothetical protein
VSTKIYTQILSILSRKFAGAFSQRKCARRSLSQEKHRRGMKNRGNANGLVGAAQGGVSIKIDI